MQDFESALNLLDGASNRMRDDIMGSFTSIRFTFMEGLVYLKEAQATTSWRKRRTLQKKASKSMKSIHSWQKGGNVNVVHALHILSAEHAVLKGKKSKAREQFKRAISVASQNGFLQDRGLAHELAGRYHLSQGDTHWARYHLEHAELSFSDWGATIKVEQLQEQKRVLLGE